MDNFFQNCPAMMSDGRHFTDYRTATRREEHIKYLNGYQRDDDYRMFLQGNAEEIINNEWAFNTNKMSCHENECIHNQPSTRVLPQLFYKERQDFDNSMKPNQPILRNTCPTFSDYRMVQTEPKQLGQKRQNLYPVNRPTQMSTQMPTQFQQQIPTLAQQMEAQLGAPQMGASQMGAQQMGIPMATQMAMQLPTQAQ